MAVLVIIILVGTAFAFPFAIHYYSDESHLNKIQYVESKDIELISNEKKQNAADIIEQVGSMAEEGGYPVPTQITSFIPDDKKLKEIEDGINNEMIGWMKANTVGLYNWGIDLSYFQDFEIDDIALMNLGGTISFFEVMITPVNYPDVTITIAVDSSSYKIYRMNIHDAYVKNTKISYYDKEDIISKSEAMAKKLQEYYGLNYTPEMESFGGDEIIYNLGGAQWEIDYGENYIIIGIDVPFR